MADRTDRTQPLFGTRQAAIALTAIGLALLALAILSLLLKDSYQVLEKGQILPYTEGFIYKVRFFDRVTLFLEPECRPSSDILNGFVLVGIAAMSLVFALLTVRAGVRADARLFWMFVVLFLGMGYLAADEVLGVHESVGHNLRFLATLPLVKRPDDLLVLSYGIPVLVFAYVFRREFMASRRALVALVLAVVLFVASAVSDLIAARLEELFEVAGALSLAAAILVLGLDHVATLMARAQTRR